MKPYERLKSIAIELGWQYLKKAKGDHEKWQHPTTGRITTLPRSNKRNARAIANIEMHLRHGADPESSQRWP